MVDHHDIICSDGLTHVFTIYHFLSKRNHHDFQHSTYHQLVNFDRLSHPISPTSPLSWSLSLDTNIISSSIMPHSKIKQPFLTNHTYTVGTQVKRIFKHLSEKKVLLRHITRKATPQNNIPAYIGNATNDILANTTTKYNNNPQLAERALARDTSHYSI